MGAGNNARTSSSSSSTESHLLPLLFFGVDSSSFASDDIPSMPGGYCPSFELHEPYLGLSLTDSGDAKADSVCVKGDLLSLRFEV